jgi:tetratricopeptide (TPR) repeat protein
LKHALASPAIEGLFPNFHKNIKYLKLHLGKLVLPLQAKFWLTTNIIKSAMDQFQQGISYFKDGKFKESLVIFNQLVTDNPTHPPYILYRGRIHSRMGSFDLALRDFDQLLSLEPKNADFISDRAVVLHLLKRNQEALFELDRALDLDPDNPYRYSSRAFLKDRSGDFEGAIADYEIAIEMDPEDAISINNKGLVEEKLGYQERAKESFKKADELVGYRPGEHNTIVEPAQEAAELPITTEEEEVDKKLTFSSYFSTLGDVFTDQNIRKDFFKFVSDKFSGKR